MLSPLLFPLRTLSGTFHPRRGLAGRAPLPWAAGLPRAWGVSCPSPAAAGGLQRGGKAQGSGTKWVKKIVSGDDCLWCLFVFKIKWPGHVSFCGSVWTSERKLRLIRSPSVHPHFKLILKHNYLDWILRPFHNSALPAKTKKEKGANGYGKPCAIALKKKKIAVWL